MSDIQDPLVVLQHRMQQRQILAMMGINQWVQPNSETMNIADISAPTILDPTTHDTGTAPISSATTIKQPNVASSNIDAINVEMSHIISADAPSSMIDDESTNHYYDNVNVDANEKSLSYPDQQSPVTYSFDTTVPDISNTAVTPLIDTVVQQAAISNINNTDSFKDDGFKEEIFKKVAPFDLQGGRYGSWVILVDIQALNNDSQKLWQNITQALSITCETTSFPICEGMDTAELANASLAGYVFKIGRSEEIRVAALTPLPEELEHPNLTTVPTLDEMLADSCLKRQFWEQLSSQG
ncbi:hypothetical protein [Psychrobacter sp. DAB_AL62B]|uniref:hypothetical protein n=1 Tax=Psychrobacter sp. DAB_AL62B TaxID=1028420 RepID=UPI00238168EC|nr:hypothetical protein [Psychrobacter sp. DAB_AL62B]MDE4454083.1 hypothetical protein [Psychrobacter sp. DAB_AL62B]